MTIRSYRTLWLSGVISLALSSAKAHQQTIVVPVGTLDRGYRAAIRSLCISVDGKTLAASSESIGLEVWDLANEKVLADSDHTKANSCCASVAINSSGKVAYVGQQEWVQVWNCRTEKVVAKLDTSLRPGDANFNPNIALKPDGKTLVIVGDHELQFWDTPTRKRRSRLKTIAQVREVAYSADGKLLVAGADNRAFVWDGKTEKLLHEFKVKPRGPDDPSYAGCPLGQVAVSADGKWVAFGTWRPEFSVWSVADAKEVATVPGKLAAFSGDGKQLYVLNHRSRHNELTAFDLATRKPVGVAKLTGWLTHCMTVSPDGKLLATGDDLGVIRLYRTKDLFPPK